MRSDEAFKLIQDCLLSKDTILDLGNLELRDHDFDIDIDDGLGSLLSRCTHLETLILSNSWRDWHENATVEFSKSWEMNNKNRGVRDSRFEKVLINYYNTPNYRPKKYKSTKVYTNNKLTKIPYVVSYLENLSTFICGGDRLEPWQISDISLLKRLKKLKTVILDFNEITEMNFLQFLPELEKLSLSGNSILSMEKISGNNQLKFLDLSRNRLKFLFQIDKFPKLRWLNVSFNKIVTINGVEKLCFLHFLGLSNNAITEIIPLTNQIFLKTLDLAHNKLTHFIGLERLYRLEYLNTSFNRICTIEGLSNLVELKYLDMSANMIRQIEGLEQFPNLTVLNISSNQIKELKCLNELLHLKFLDASYNFIRTIEKTQIPKNLERLILNCNHLSSLQCIGHLSQLKELCVVGNAILNFEELVIEGDLIKSVSVFLKLQNLYHLDISHNKVGSLSGLKVLHRLKTLIASENHLADISDIGSLNALKYVNLSANTIVDVNAFRKISSINILYLNQNHIEVVDGLSNLSTLEVLNVSFNKIRDIKIFDSLTALEELNFSFNIVEEIPSFELLVSLKFLYLQGNLLAHLDNIHKLFKIPYVDISGNPIINIKGLITFMSKNKELIFREEKMMFFGNSILIRNMPYLIIPYEIQLRGIKNILNWFIAREQGGLINIDAKCILFGNGEVGKTALSHYLRTGKFIEKNNRTHGIIIKKWQIPIENLPESFRRKIQEAYRLYVGINQMKRPETCSLSLWDFGGQEYYHATHRLFMSTNVLYLLLWHKDSNYQNEKKGNYPVSYWVKNINHYSPNNITLTIENKTQNEHSGVDNSLTFKIQEYQKGNKKNILQYKLDIDNLRNGILNKFEYLPHIGLFIPKIYNDISQVLQNSKKPFITYSQYQEICRQTDNTKLGIMEDPSQTETLIKYLDDIGSVVCFRFRKEIQIKILQDYVFTDPVWLTKIIYEILEKEKDEFDEAHVKNVASKHGLSATLWIEIMKQFELIFEIDTRDGPKYVAPQYLPVKCKNPLAYDLALEGKTMEHSFSLNYPDFLPKSNFLRLIARFGAKSINYVYSRDSFIFFHNGCTILAQCISTEQERKIKIYIQNKDRKVANEIFESLLDIDPNENMELSIDDRNYVLEKKLRVKVSVNDLEVDSTTGRTLKTENFRFLYEKYYSVKSIIGDMTNTKTIKIFVSYSSKDSELQRLIIRGLKDHLGYRKDYSFSFWTDKTIDMGADWKDTVNQNLNDSDAAILLVSATFTASEFVQKVELAKFFQRKKDERYLILPVLIRNYDFAEFEELSSLQFFKTYYRQYGFNKPVNRDNFLPFDVLAESDNTTDKQLQDYYKNLADAIYLSVKNHFENIK